MRARHVVWFAHELGDGVPVVALENESLEAVECRGGTGCRWLLLEKFLDDKGVRCAAEPAGVGERFLELQPKASGIAHEGFLARTRQGGIGMDRFFCVCGGLKLCRQLYLDLAEMPVCSRFVFLGFSGSDMTVTSKDGYVTLGGHESLTMVSYVCSNLDRLGLERVEGLAEIVEISLGGFQVVLSTGKSGTQIVERVTGAVQVALDDYERVVKVLDLDLVLLCDGSLDLGLDHVGEGLMKGSVARHDGVLGLFDEVGCGVRFWWFAEVLRRKSIAVEGV